MQSCCNFNRLASQRKNLNISLVKSSSVTSPHLSNTSQAFYIEKTTFIIIFVIITNQEHPKYMSTTSRVF